MYGNLKEHEKETLADEIGRYFDEHLRIGELVLYDTAGAPPGWRCRARLALGDAVS